MNADIGAISQQCKVFFRNKRTKDKNNEKPTNPGLSPDTAESGAWKRPDPQEGYSDSQWHKEDIKGATTKKLLPANKLKIMKTNRLF